MRSMSDFPESVFADSVFVDSTFAAGADVSAGAEVDAVVVRLRAG